jgi:hypothetical protein
VAGSNSEEFAPVQAADAPRELDHRALEPEAEPEERHAAFARVPDDLELALDPPPSEPARHDDAVDVAQHLVDVALVDVVGGHPVDLDVDAVVEPAVLERLDHRQVRVPQVHVLADDRHAHRVDGRVDPFDERLPLGHVGLGVDPQVLRELRVQALLGEDQRDAVDRVRVLGRDHAADRHVAQEADLLLQVPPDRPVRTAHDRVGLQTERPQLLHRVLRRLGLQLAGRPDERHQADVDERAPIAPHLVAELADRLQERERLDVADRPPDLDDHEVGVLGRRMVADPVLDLVGDVRDHLHGLAQVVAATLLGDHGAVDGAGRQVRAAVEVLVGEAFVVAEVEVGLGAVVEHEHLAVLERVHRPRVDVHVGVELLERDAEPAGAEERPSDAVVIPLPRPEATPPVTKTYFGCFCTSGWHRSRGG